MCVYVVTIWGLMQEMTFIFLQRRHRLRNKMLSICDREVKENGCGKRNGQDHYNIQLKKCNGNINTIKKNKQ